MYQPDRAFMIRLKRLDGRLGCKFDGTHGHFVVNYRRASGHPVPIFAVMNDEGGFRQPDKRDLDFLSSGDLEREDMETKLQKSALYMERVREKSRKDAHDAFRDATKDDKIQLMNSFGRLGGGGKGNSAFRRVQPRSKGEVF